MKKFGACFVGCGEIVQSLGQKCMDIESANGSEQTEDKKLASPIQMEVDDAQSPEENQNSNNIECSERSNISCLYFLFEFLVKKPLDLGSSHFQPLENSDWPKEPE